MKFRLLTIVGLTLVGGVAEAKNAAMRFEELVAASDLVIVARVQSVEKGTATARVLETLQGKPVARVRYWAMKTWPCDTSHVEVGETVVLFLEPPDGEGVRSITNSGVGRGTVTLFGGRHYVDLRYYDSLCPPGAAVARFRRPDGGRLEDRYVALDALRKAFAKPSTR